MFKSVEKLIRMRIEKGLLDTVIWVVIVILIEVVLEEWWG